MTTTLDRLGGTFPHGTPDGYRAGCKTAACPAPLPCRDVYRRYSGDLSFARLIDAGTPLADILAAEEADRAALAARDRAAARAARHQDTPARAPRTRAPKQPRAPRPVRNTALWDQIAALHADGLTDALIADELGKSRRAIADVRRQLNLTANRAPRAEAAPRTVSERTLQLRQRAQRLRDLHGAGLTDQEIADELGMTRAAVNQLRSRMGLPVNRVARTSRPRQERQPRTDRTPEVVALVDEGLTDQEIADRLGMTLLYARRLRQRAGRPANRSLRTKWDSIQLQPHGTNACYARGCRNPECVEAHKQYHRDYTRRRRAEGARQYHGTAYGYQLGCHDRDTCPTTPTCADASLAAENARRRAAGIPQKTLVDAAPVQAHIRDLIHAGTPLAQIADTAGLNLNVVRKMIHSRGEGRGIVEQVLAERAAAVLAVPLETKEAIA